MNLHDGAVDMYAHDDHAKPKRPPKADVGVYPAEAARQSDDQEGRAALWKPRRDYEAMDMARYLLFTRMPVSPLPGGLAALIRYIGSQWLAEGEGSQDAHCFPMRTCMYGLHAQTGKQGRLPRFSFFVALSTSSFTCAA